jgi:uncharacterized membrane protein
MDCTFILVKWPHITLPQGFSANFLILLRWMHLASGVLWLGLLYFFNLVNFPFMQEMEGPVRMKVVPLLMPRALWWFRWASVATVLAGITYWMMIVGTDARNAGASGGLATASFFIIWTLVFVIEMALLMSPAEALKRGPVFGSVVGVALVAGAYLYVALNSHGWESNRLLSIGIGGGFGWFMLLNVWGIVWRAQKKIIRWTQESTANHTPMPETAKLARMTFLSARLNFVLSFPMLFFMAAASHYPILGS